MVLLPNSVMDSLLHRDSSGGSWFNHVRSKRPWNFWRLERSTLDSWQIAIKQTSWELFQRIVGGEISCWQNNETLRSLAMRFLWGMIFLCFTMDWLCFGKCFHPGSAVQRSEVKTLGFSMKGKFRNLGYFPALLFSCCLSIFAFQSRNKQQQRWSTRARNSLSLYCCVALPFQGQSLSAMMDGSGAIAE